MKSKLFFALAAAVLILPAMAADKFPPLGPLTPAPIPKDNPQSADKVALGKQLFWESRLSGDGSMPCVSCHLPGLGWGDGGQISRGYPGTKHWRNSQTVINSAYYNKLFWEGSVTSLEGQAPSAAEGGVAGNGDPSVMEMRLAKPKADGSMPKTSFMCEKGNYWSNNYMNTTSFASLGLICGAGNRPGRMISRGGGHQRGGLSAGGGSGWLSPEKHPGRRKKDFNLDLWLMQGNMRFAWVIGTTWVASMMGSNALAKKMRELTVENPYQITSLEREAIFETLKLRVDSGGMVMANSDLYPVAPVGTDFADIVFPVSSWGEDNFTRCNSERRLRLYSKFYDAPGESKPDWWIVQKFAQKMGFDKDGGYAWKDSNDVFEEAARFSRGGVLNYHPLAMEAKAKGIKAQELLRTYGTTGIQTPIRVKDGKLVGTKRLHDPSNNWGEMEQSEIQIAALYAFNTHSGKAILLKSPWNYAGWIQFYNAIKPRAEKGELWITNGRVNETWQSGFDDLRKPYLSKRWPEAFLFIHPDDAKKKSIESGDYVEVVNDTVYIQTGQPQGVLDADLTFNQLMKDGHIMTTVGKFRTVAVVSDEMRPGVCKANFNFPASPANAVVSAVPDPMTNNYRYKLGRGVLTRIGESPYKHSFTQMSLKPRNIV